MDRASQDRIPLMISQEMNVPNNKTGLIWSCANAGLALGALGFGLLVDIIGRKWAFNLTCLITSIFGMLLVSGSPRLEDATDRRPRPSSTTAPSAVSTSWPRSDLAATSPSTRPSRSSSCPRAAATSSPSCPSSSPSA